MDQILRIKRPDTYNRFNLKNSKNPNRIPWTTYYVVPYVTEEELGKLFKTAWIIFPNRDLITSLTMEWIKVSEIDRDLSRIALTALQETKACILVPTYVTSKDCYAFQFSRRSFKNWASNFGEGFGKFYFLQDGKFKAACSYCPHNVHFLVHECSPGTETCRVRIKRGNTHVF